MRSVTYVAEDDIGLEFPSLFLSFYNDVGHFLADDFSNIKSSYFWKFEKLLWKNYFVEVNYVKV